MAREPDEYTEHGHPVYHVPGPPSEMDDWPRPEYDFKQLKAVRGKYAERYRKSSTMITQAELKAKWDELCEACSEEGGDPYPAWLAFLNNHGLESSWSFGMDWGEYGILPFVDDLVEIINKGEKLEILVDPSREGSSEVGYLAFRRDDARSG